MSNETPEEGKIKTRYDELTSLRDAYRDRAREYSKVTLPYLMPETETGTESSEFQNDYNTEGAKLTNALANRYVNTLFPAGRSFIALDLKEEDYAAQEKQGNSKASIESIFATITRDFRKVFEDINSRAVMLDVLKHLIVTGNGLVYKPQDGLIMNYALDEYVVLRSLDGSIQEIITEDRKAVQMLDDELKKQVITAMDIKEEDIKETTVSLFTYIRRGIDDKDTWYVDQAVESIPVGDQNSYSTEKLRWFPVMWNRTRRESYGRGLVEEHFGSLWTLSILTEAMAVGCVTLADIKFMVRPGSLLDVAALNASASGSYHYGEADDVTSISTDKSRDMMLIKDVMDYYTRHLGEVFMYLPSTMRDAERVTAEENRLRARELENAHGGVYSALATSLQKPLAKLIFQEMGISDIETKGVELSIATGLSALSRGNENDKINHWLSDVSVTNNLPDDIRSRLRLSDFLKVTAAGRDVDYSKFLMDEAEAATKAQAQQAAVTQQEAQSSAIDKASAEQLAAAQGQQPA